jgi:hypothetical protein
MAQKKQLWIMNQKTKANANVRLPNDIAEHTALLGQEPKSRGLKCIGKT